MLPQDIIAISEGEDIIKKKIITKIKNIYIKDVETKINHSQI